MKTKIMLTRLLIAMLLASLVLASMPIPSAQATTLARYAGAGADDASFGTVAWTDPGNITGRDDIAASAILGAQATSHYLSGSNFGLTVPNYATILGIKVAIRRKASHPGWVKDEVVQLVKGGVPVGINKADTVTTYDGSYLVATYGGPATLWGTTWTPAEVNTTDFGVLFSAFNTHTLNNRTVYVDSVQVTVTYKTETTTSVDCAPASLTYGASTTCTATVTRSGGTGTPTGDVNWTTDGTGDFSSSSCSLSGLAGTSTCQVTYTPGEVGTGSHLVSAEYMASVTYIGSSGNDTITVNPRAITVTAQNASKAYGDPDPTLPYSITSGSLVSGDALSGALSRDTGEDIGTYDILQGSLNGGTSYVITFQGATFTITERPITVTADSKFKLVGDPDPALTYTITSGSLLGGDSLSGALTREPGETIGTYAILQGTLSAPANYDMTFVPGVLKIDDKIKVMLYSAAANDGWVLESSEPSGTGGSFSTSGNLFVGDDAQDRQYRSILSFDTSALPDDATILKVVLKIRRQGLVGTNPFQTHQLLVVDLRQGNFGSSASLQANDFESGSTFQNAGSFSSTPLANNWYKATFKATALPLINLTGNTQLRLRFQLPDNDDLSADYMKFYSGNAIPENQPVLIITYQP